MHASAGYKTYQGLSPAALEQRVRQRRASEAGVSGIEIVHSEESHVPLPDAVADRVFIAFVLHEADDPVALLGEAARLLRPAGEVVVVDWHKTEGTPGPPLAHRIGVDEVAATGSQVGLRVLPAPYQSADFYLARLARRDSAERRLHRRTRPPEGAWRTVSTSAHRRCPPTYLTPHLSLRFGKTPLTLHALLHVHQSLPPTYIPLSGSV